MARSGAVSGAIFGLLAAALFGASTPFAKLLLPGFGRPDARPEPDDSDDRGSARLRSRLGGNRLIAPPVADRAAVVARKPAGPVAEALARGLALARRRAAARALGETLRQQPADAPLLPLWNLLTEKNLPAALTIGDLLTAVRDLPGA